MRAKPGTRTPCSFDGCEKPVMSLGYCQRHRDRLVKGQPLHLNRLDPLDVRFWRFVVMGPNGCWAWAGKPNKHGYGSIRANKKTLAAHRVSYELNVGPIPDGLTIDHLCANRRCVNPAHLEPVTAGENARRGKARTTHCPKGHEYTPENTYVRPSTPGRMCRICRSAERRTGRAESLV